MEHLQIPVKGDEIHLYPIGDVQIGARGVDLNGFQRYVDEALADPLARFIGVGDYTDGVSPSNRKKLRMGFVSGELYDTARDMFDEAARQQVHQFLDIVKPTRKRWDFLLEGHHLWRFEDGTSTDQIVADAVGCRNLQDGSALVSYQFKSGPPLRMYVRHGESAGRTFAGPLQQLEQQMRAFTAHIYVIAHHHKLVAAGAVKLEESPTSATNLAATDSRLVATGSWLRGYLKGETTYAERGMMVPLATGAPMISAQRRRDGTFRVRVVV